MLLSKEDKNLLVYSGRVVDGKVNMSKVKLIVWVL